MPYTIYGKVCGDLSMPSNVTKTAFSITIVGNVPKYQDLNKNGHFKC